MSDALQRACQALNIGGEMRERQVAERIIALARAGIMDAEALSERVVAEFKTVPLER